MITVAARAYNADFYAAFRVLLRIAAGARREYHRGQDDGES